MTGTLTALFFAMLAFVGGHFLLSWRPVRSKLVARLGEGVFSGAYSVLMVLALVWVIAAYRSAPPLMLWDLGPGARHLPIVVMPFALMLAVLGLASRNPTAVRGEALLERQSLPIQGVLTITRHAFLSAAALWALFHLAANGDAASALLFGGMAILAIFGMVAIDTKRARKLGAKWEPFAAATSRVPFAAALAGRTKVDWRGIGWVRPLIGLVLYAVLLIFHGWLFGVPALPH